ncbi:hypothetical protein CPB97_001548 [Podila verticillata]|nr:hypothetical protein CPB97_001548 [Podila verticillata]
MLSKIPGYVEKVLRLSDLQILSFECGAYDPCLVSHLRGVLEPVNWSALRTLALSGNSIDGQIGLWVKCANMAKLAPFEVQLMNAICKYIQKGCRNRAHVVSVVGFLIPADGYCGTMHDESMRHS